MQIWWWFVFTCHLFRTASNRIGAIGSWIHYFWLSFLVCYFFLFGLWSTVYCSVAVFNISFHYQFVSHCRLLCRYLCHLKQTKQYRFTIYWLYFIAIITLGCTCVTIFSTFFSVNSRIDFAFCRENRIFFFYFISIAIVTLIEIITVTHSLCHKSHEWKTVASSTCSQQTNRIDVELRGYVLLRVLGFLLLLWFERTCKEAEAEGK